MTFGFHTTLTSSDSYNETDGHNLLKLYNFYKYSYSKQVICFLHFNYNKLSQSDETAQLKAFKHCLHEKISTKMLIEMSTFP